VTRADCLVAAGDALLFADGLDAAIVGVLLSEDAPRVVYSIPRVIEIFCRMGMTSDEALDFFEYNVVGSYVGEQTPLFVDRC
jgi:hypothetical protein